MEECARDVADDRLGRADRVIINLPDTAGAFPRLAAVFASEPCTMHFYDIQSEEAPFEPGLAAIRTAAGADHRVTAVDRRVVRSASPKDQNVCLGGRLGRVE